jgi:phosphate transport system protein
MLVNYKEKLDETKKSIKEIGNSLIEANTIITDALKDCKAEKFNDAKLAIKNISNKTNEIDNDIITTLALHSPEARDLRTMVSYLKITNELVRACSNTRSFIKGFQEVCQKVDIKTIKEYAIPMQKATVEALVHTVAMIDVDCVDEIQECFNKVLIAENKTDDLYEMIENAIIKQADKSDNFSRYHQMLSSLRKSEKVADRAISIASLLLFANNGGEIHQV